MKRRHSLSRDHGGAGPGLRGLYSVAAEKRVGASFTLLTGAGPNDHELRPGASTVEEHLAEVVAATHAADGANIDPGNAPGQVSNFM